MRALRRFFRRLTYWATIRQDEERLRAEIEEHLELQVDENIRVGLSPMEARRQAVLKFGGVEAVKESYREQRSLPSLERLVQDIRYGLRRLRATPSFTAATVLTLALGIGASTSIFTLVNAVLLKSLPVANPAELYRLGRTSRCCYTSGFSQEEEFSLVSYDLYKYLRDNTKGFSELAAFPSLLLQFGVRRSGKAEGAQSSSGEFVSGNYFAMFGIKPYAGRLLTPADDAPDAPPVAVMSFRLWQQRYGADPSVIGSVFNFNDKLLTVVGVTPPGFFGDTLRNTPPDFFLPLNTEPFVQSDADLKKYETHWLRLIGRIEPGLAPEAVEAQMRVALKQWLRSHWGEMNAGERTRLPEQTLFLRPGGAGITSMREQYQRWLQILMAATGLVLLIVCANVANLMLVRGLERRRQTSLSVALGARASRVVREPLIESLLLSFGGGAIGVLLATAGTRLLLEFAFPSLPGAGAVPIDASPSVPVMAFAFATSLVTGVVFGIAPALLALRADPIEALRGSGGAAMRTGSTARKTLVVLQAALSLALLSAAGLLTAALGSLEHRDFGFEQEGRLVASVNPRLAGYRTAQLSLLYKRIRNSIADIPGVTSVAMCLYSPPGGGWGSGVWLDGQPPPAPGAENVALWNRVTDGYFQVVSTPVLRGRAISENDTATSRRVAVINEAFAKKFFAGEDPVGRHFGRQAGASREFEIVGVVKDARYIARKLDEPDLPMYFLPEAQAEYEQTNLGSLFLHDVVILTRPGAALSAASIRQALAAVNPDLPITSILTLREQVANQFNQPRLIARLTSLYGLLSLLLASIGIYGVIAYNAARRTNEIGVRVAVGATRGDIVRLVLGGALGLIVTGMLIGLPLAFAVGRLLGSQLYGTKPFNPSVTLAAAGVLGLSALLASLVPAFRAGRVSPMDALRAD